MLTCNGNGEWEVFDKQNSILACSCVGGYELSGDKTFCKKCPRGLYKDTASNTDVCKKCPENSKPSFDRDGCECDRNTFRENDNASTGCEL